MFGENLMKRFYVLALTVALLFALGSVSSFASPMTFDDIEYWVGSGVNQAALVIDWNDGVSPECLVWGYRWDGDAKGQDMFMAVVGQTDVDGPSPSTRYGADARLSAKATDWGTMGLFLDEIAYSDSSVEHKGTAGGSLWWAYSNRVDGETWAEASLGMSGRTLSDDDWDGWAFVVNVDFPSDLTPASFDGQISTPVAEPGYLSLAALALAGLGRRRRR
jgi:uncharacterized protein (TIGR03382 family)